MGGTVKLQDALTASGSNSSDFAKSLCSLWLLRDFTPLCR